MVSDLDVGDALTNRLDDTSTLVTEHDGERALGIVSGELQEAEERGAYQRLNRVSSVGQSSSR